MVSILFLRSILVSMTAFAIGAAAAPSRADGFVLTETVVNDTGVAQSRLSVAFSASDLHDLVLTVNAPLCPPPETQSVSTGGDTVSFVWPCNCVQPGESVTFTVHSVAGGSRVSTTWSAFRRPCHEVYVRPVRVIDVNGDTDGFADTNETVDLVIAVANKWKRDLTNVVATLSTTDPRIDCIIEPSVSLGTVPAGADVVAPASFRFHVHPRADRGGPAVVCNNPGPAGTCSNFVSVSGGCTADAQCRRTVLEDYRADLFVTLAANQSGVQGAPQAIAIDLDLNATHSAGSTATFVEGFEAPFGFGNFTFLNLDEARATNALSDGQRCQYSDPDFPNSNSFGETECYLGFAAGQSPVNSWHVHAPTAVDGGRAYVGQKSLHYGTHSPGNPNLDTTLLSQLDTLRTAGNVHLAARVCASDPSANKRACNVAADCAAVGGGPCVSASPELSFKQQISLADSRRISGAPSGHGLDRAVVQVQIDGSSIWQKVHPFRNVYDSRGVSNFGNCFFDPIDDGNTEDDYFDPSDPARRFGPSSTCFPELVFGYQGDTDAAFHASNVGNASDGPGLAGNMGIGTWVETKFELSRFRGRSIKFRFLFTSVKVADVSSWESLLMWNPTPEDDGWYIDDVRLTQTLGATAPVVSLDNADNGSLPGNADGDERGDECDCAPSNAGAFAVPPEVPRIAIALDKVTLSWDSVAAVSGSGTVHDVLRGAVHELPVGAGASEICLASVPGTTASDPANPVSGRAFFYLVRGRNVCAPGPYGFRSNGAPRTSAACP